MATALSQRLHREHVRSAFAVSWALDHNDCDFTGVQSRAYEKHFCNLLRDGFMPIALLQRRHLAHIEMRLQSLAISVKFRCNLVNCSFMAITL